MSIEAVNIGFNTGRNHLLSKRTTKNTESIEQAELIQEPASVSMVDNARNKLAAITERTHELQGLIDKKTAQIDEIETAIDTTEQDYEEAERRHNDLGQRVTRETVKLDVAKGTMAEEERAEIFASVVRVFEKAQKGLAQAAIDRDEARAKQGLIQSIREELDEHQRELSELALLRREYEAVFAEVHAQKGRDLAQAIADAIIAARDAYEQAEQVLKERSADYEAATRRIATLKDEYPDLCAEMWTTHGHLLSAEPRKQAGVYCLEGLRQYITILLTHGPKAGRRIYDDTKELAEYLALTVGDVKSLINGNSYTQSASDAWGREIKGGTPWHPSFDKIDTLIREVQASDYRRY